MGYEEALVNSPRWIKDAYAEFIKLPAETRKKIPFLYFVLGRGKGTPPFKMSKSESNYKDPSSNKDFICGNCLFYYPNPVRKIAVCSQIRGNVSYDAICSLWAGENSIVK